MEHENPDDWFIEAIICHSLRKFGKDRRKTGPNLLGKAFCLREPEMIRWNKRLSPKGSEIRTPDLLVAVPWPLSLLIQSDIMQFYAPLSYTVKVGGLPSPPPVYWALVDMGRVHFIARMLQVHHKQEPPFLVEFAAAFLLVMFHPFISRLTLEICIRTQDNVLHETDFRKLNSLFLGVDRQPSGCILPGKNNQTYVQAQCQGAVR